MYTDPFDFITTRSNPVPMLEDASDSIRLLPYVPADFNLSPSIAQGTSKAKDLSLHALIASDLAKIPNNAPAYQYTTQQEKRYDNPYLQYTPSNILGTDTEDIYGRIQGAPSQLANALLKTGANFGGTFFSNFLSAPKTFDLVRGGEIFEENDKFSTIQNWLMAMEDKLPNYYTEVERNRSEWINAIPFSGGAMNFWGDKVVKNIGFSMGALTSGLVIDAGITAAATALTGGAGTPVAILNGLNRLRKTTPALFTSMRNLAKSGDKMDDITAIARQTGNFSKGLEVSALSRIPTVAKYATVSYLTAQGEAFIEGYHTWLDTKRELLEDAIYRGETDEATMADIDKRAKHAGRWTTGLNMPIIMASNLFQFPNLLMGRNVLGRQANDFVKTQIGNVGEEGLTKGLKAMSTFSTKKALRKEGWEAVQDIAWEGAEEGAQYHIGSSVHDYYSNRLNPYLKSDLLGFVLKNIPETLSDDQFWKEAGIGGLTGFLMGSPSAINRLRKGREQADQTVQSLNNVYDRFNSAVKQYSSTIDLNNSNSNETIAAHDTLYASVHDSLKFGTYDSFLASLRDLKEMNLDEYNKGFNQEFKSAIERDQFVDSLIQDSEDMKADVEKVNSFYQTNPYTTNPIVSKIRKALNPQNEEELNSIQENLFNDYKEVVARNESLLRKTNGLILNLKGNLRSFGMKEESLDYLVNLAQSPKGFKDYLKYKEAQIKDFQRQVTYYEELAKNVTDTSPTLNPKRQLEQAKDNLDAALKYYEKVYDKLEQLEKDPKNKEVQDSIREDVVYEESTEEQRDKYVQEKKKRELERLEEAENLRKATEAEVEKPEKLAEQILDANAKAEEEATPLPVTRPVTPNINPLADFKIGEDVIIDGKKYTVESLGLEPVVKDAANPNLKYKTDGKTVTPMSVDAKIAQTELPFEDSQSLQDKIESLAASIKKLPFDTIKQLSKFLNTTGTFKEIEDEADAIANSYYKDNNTDLINAVDNELKQTDPVEEYISPEVKLPEPKPVALVTRGDREFTINEIQNYPNTFWIRAESAFQDPSKVFEIQEGGFFTRKLVGVQDGVKISEGRNKEGLLTFDKLRKEVNEGNTFVQVLHKGELLIADNTLSYPLRSVSNSQTIEELNNKKVFYKGQVGVLRVLDGKVEIETDSNIYEIDTFDSKYARDYSIFPFVEQVEEILPKYKIKFRTENSVSVNDVVYNLQVNKNGNITGLIPINNPQQVIKNERMLVAVEIERNKQEYKTVDQVETDKKEEIVNSAKNSIDDVSILENIFSVNTTGSIALALDDLYNDKILSRKQLAQLESWLTSKQLRLDSLVKEYPSSEVFKKGKDNVDILLAQLLIQKKSLVKEYDISDVSETNVVVDGVSYTLITNEFGNIVGLKNRGSILKNERLLVQVEIERNKLEYSQVQNIPKETKQEVIDNSKELKLLEAIWSNQITETVSNTLDGLLEDQKESFSEQAYLQTEVWLKNNIYKLEKLIEDEYSGKNETLENSWLVLNNILESLYEHYNSSKNEKQDQINKGSDKQFTNNVPSKRKTKSVASKQKSNVKKQKISQEEIDRVKKEEEEILRLIQEEELLLKKKEEEVINSQIQELLDNIDKNSLPENIPYFISAIDFILDSVKDSNNINKLLSYKEQLKQKLIPINKSFVSKTDLEEELFLEQLDEVTATDKDFISKQEAVKEKEEAIKEQNEEPVSSTEQDIKKFLGKGNTSLYKTMEDQITKGKIKLECQ